MAKRLFIALTVATLLAAPMALAQDAPQMVSVYTVHTKLGHQQDFEAEIGNVWAAFSKHGVDVPIGVRISVSDPGAYSFAVPLTGLAQLDEVNAKIEKAYASIPSVMEKAQATQSHWEQSIWAARPDLSHTPENPRVDTDGSVYSRVQFIYVHPHQAGAFEDQVRKAMAMREKHGITDGVAVYQLSIGPDGPVYAALVDGKDEADFYAHNAKTQEKLGQAWQDLLQATGPMIRRIEYSAAITRPDLAYSP